MTASKLPQRSGFVKHWSDATIKTQISQLQVGVIHWELSQVGDAHLQVGVAIIKVSTDVS